MQELPPRIQRFTTMLAYERIHHDATALALNIPLAVNNEILNEIKRKVIVSSVIVPSRENEKAEVMVEQPSTKNGESLFDVEVSLHSASVIQAIEAKLVESKFENANEAVDRVNDRRITETLLADFCDEEKAQEHPLIPYHEIL